MVRITETEDEDVPKERSVASSPRTPRCRAIDQKRDFTKAAYFGQCHCFFIHLESK